MPLAVVVAAVVVLGLPHAAAAWAPQEIPPDVLESAVETAKALEPLAMLAPLGISPFLALGLLGAGSAYTDLVLPPNLAFLAHPALWIGLLGLAALLQVGRSFKLTKPVAEMVGTTESLVALLALAAMFVTPEAAAAEPEAALEASVLGIAVTVLGAMSGLVIVIAVRMGFDLLTWLSPVPLIDAVLQFGKLAATAVLVAIAIFLPAVAVVLNLAVLVAALVAARWLIRVARFGTRVVWDGVVGRMRPATVTLGEGEAGPFPAFAIRNDAGLPRLGVVEVRWAPAGGWSAAPGGRRAGSWTGLGTSAESRFHRGLIGTTLHTPRARLFVTARYHRALDGLSGHTGTPVTRSGWAENPSVEMRTV